MIGFQVIVTDSKDRSAQVCALKTTVRVLDGGGSAVILALQEDNNLPLAYAKLT